MDSYGDTSGRIGRDWLDRHDEELEQELLDDELNLDELFGPEQEDAPGELSRRRYFRELFRLQRELVKLQNWVVHTGHKVVILFEGRDAAGKGGVIKRITQRLNPRVCRAARAERPRADPVVFPALRLAPAGRWRDRPVRPQLVQPCRGRAGHGFLQRRTIRGILPQRA